MSSGAFRGGVLPGACWCRCARCISGGAGCGVHALELRARIACERLSFGGGVLVRLDIVNALDGRTAPGVVIPARLLITLARLCARFHACERDNREPDEEHEDSHHEQCCF